MLIIISLQLLLAVKCAAASASSSAAAASSRQASHHSHGHHIAAAISIPHTHIFSNFFPSNSNRPLRAFAPFSSRHFSSSPSSSVCGRSVFVVVLLQQQPAVHYFFITHCHCQKIRDTDGFLKASVRSSHHSSPFPFLSLFFCFIMLQLMADASHIYRTVADSPPPAPLLLEVDGDGVVERTRAPNDGKGINNTTYRREAYRPVARRIALLEAAGMNQQHPMCMHDDPSFSPLLPPPPLRKFSSYK